MKITYIVQSSKLLFFFTPLNTDQCAMRLLNATNLPLTEATAKRKLTVPAWRPVGVSGWQAGTILFFLFFPSLSKDQWF